MIGADSSSVLSFEPIRIETAARGLHALWRRWLIAPTSAVVKPRYQIHERSDFVGARGSQSLVGYGTVSQSLTT
jgi:hypothetical protein